MQGRFAHRDRLWNSVRIALAPAPTSSCSHVDIVLYTSRELPRVEVSNSGSQASSSTVRGPFWENECVGKFSVVNVISWVRMRRGMTREKIEGHLSSIPLVSQQLATSPGRSIGQKGSASPGSSPASLLSLGGHSRLKSEAGPDCPPSPRECSRPGSGTQGKFQSLLGAQTCHPTHKTMVCCTH